MIGRGSVSMIRVGLVLVLALAAAVAANIVLLGVANGPKDPVGRLSPRAGIVRLPAGSPTVPSTPKAKGSTTSGDRQGRETPDD
jgi:hypothetical protein